jgi:hypothetical protein
MKFSEFMAQHPEFDRGNGNHGAMLMLADGSYIIITARYSEYATPADDAEKVDAFRYRNIDDTEEDCIAWSPDCTCEQLTVWVAAQKQIKEQDRYEH